MAATINGNVSVDSRFTGTVSSGPNAGSNVAQISHTETYTDGSGSRQANKVFAEERINNGNYDYDVAGGVVDAFGTTLTFTRITSITIENMEIDTGKNIQVGGGSNPFISWLIATGDGVKIGPGGILVLTSPIDGFSVTAGTADILRITTAAAYRWRIQITGS